jgi:hypothetical protein
VSQASRRLAAILLIVFPTVVFGGFSLLSMLIGNVEGYQDNPMRQDLWRAGHAHAGVLLILSLVFLRYIDEAHLSERAKNLTRVSVPIAAIMLPVAFFLSVLSPDATEPSAIIYLAYLGGVVLIAGMLSLGVGLLRASRQ